MQGSVQASHIASYECRSQYQIDTCGTVAVSSMWPLSNDKGMILAAMLETVYMTSDFAFLS